MKPLGVRAIWRSRLSYRLILTSSLFIGTIALIHGLHSISDERKMLQEQLDDHGSALTNATAIFCVDQMLVGKQDAGILDDYLERLGENRKNIEFAMIERNDGKVVTDYPVGVSRRDALPEGCRTYTADIKVSPGDESSLGRVTIGLSTRKSDALVAARTWSLLFQTLLAFVVLAILLSILVKRSVGDPLHQLDRKAAALGRGDLETPIRLNRVDELGRLAQTLDEMRKNLRQGYSEIQEQNLKLKEMDRLKSQFLANMSHEIRTPMNGVVGMTSLLLDTDLSDEQRDYVEVVRTSGDALLTVINDILDFSKIEAGKLELEMEEFDLRSTVENVVELVAARGVGKGLEMCCLVDPDVHTSLLGDAGRLRQVLTNLLGNAVKFTEKGEVVIRALLASENEKSAVIRFEVRDTGIGIPRESMGKIFESFSQGDGSATRKYGGTGLGLAICRQLVELMGGKIGVESEVGRGSVFHFTAAFAKQAGVVRDLPVATDLHGVRILCVDDNATNRIILQRQLTGFGVESECVEDAGQALERLRQVQASDRPFAIAILDMNMPGMDGGELARTIKADPALASIPIVMLSSSMQPRTRKAGLTGITRFLTKPVRQSKLQDCLVSVLGAAGVPGEEPAAKSGAETIATTKGRKRVLVVEDNITNQRVAVQLLESLGCLADVAANGLEAVETLSRIGYDLVLMDCNMPEMDGFIATAEIRKRKSSMHTPIVAMTANALHGDRERCLAAGMDDYISKPIGLEDLRRVLTEWIREPGVASPEPAGPRPAADALARRDERPPAHTAATRAYGGPPAHT